MTYEDYRQRVEVFQTNQLLLDYNFTKLASIGDTFIETGEKDDAIIDTLLGNIDQLVVSSLMDNLTLLTMAMMLLHERFITPSETNSVGILDNVSEVLDYCKRFPVLETIQKYLNGELSNEEVENLVKSAPHLKVVMIDSAISDSVYLQKVSSITTFIETDRLLTTPITDILKVSALTDDAFDKIGVSESMPEMVMARFIVNYTNLYVSLVSTIAVFKTEHI